MKNWATYHEVIQERANNARQNSSSDSVDIDGRGGKERKKGEQNGKEHGREDKEAEQEEGSEVDENDENGEDDFGSSDDEECRYDDASLVEPTSSYKARNKRLLKKSNDYLPLDLLPNEVSHFHHINQHSL